MDLFLQIEQSCISALHRDDVPAAKKSLDELSVEIHSIQNAAKKMEAHQRLANIRERSEELRQSTTEIMFTHAMKKQLSLPSQKTMCISFTRTESFRTPLLWAEAPRQRQLTQR